jgi:vitamin B12 transporter
MFTPRIARLCCAVSLLILTSVSVFSQSPGSVSGCVVDPSHALIRGASIFLNSLQMQTDEKGCFTFNGVKSGKYRLKVLAEAFSPYEQELAVENSVKLEDIVLDIRPVEATTVVTATRSLASTNQIASSVDVIDAGQIDASHIETASELLRNSGGMSVVRSGSTGGFTSLFTRGGESDYTKILLDGIPVNQPGGAYDFAHLTTDNIGRVEIVRGPQSALFGSDAMTGVVQLFTRPGAGSPEGDYSVEGGNYGTFRQSAGIRGSWKKFDWSNTFSRLDTDNIQPNSDYRNASYFGNFGFTPDSRQSLRGTLFHVSSREGTPGVNAPGFFSFGPNDHAEGMERAVGLTYRTLVGSRLTQNFAYRGYEHDYKFFSAFGVNPAAHIRHRAEYHGDVALGFGSFSYGFDFDRENGKVANQSHLRNNSGFYAQQQVEVWGRLSVTGGIRIENNTTYDTSANPKAGVSLRVARDTRLRFNVGTGIKEPSFIENFSPNSFFLGNPNLLPERARSWEVGIEQSAFANRLTGTVTWFDNRFRNVIELVSKPDFTGQYQNIGRSLARGLEFRTRARVRLLMVQANYTYLDGHIQESSQSSFPFRPGDPLLRRPKHSGDVTLTWTDRKWTARWTTRAVGRRADSDFFTYSVPLQSNPGYSVSDAAFTYKFARPVSAFVRLENIFDHSYQEILGYRALGRSVVVGTQLRIGREK